MTDALNWRPDIHLPDASVRIADVARPLTAHESWRATLGGHIYLLVGTGPTPETHNRITGYVGITESQTSGRPWASLTHWVRNNAALRLDTVALVTLHTDPGPDVLRVLESAVIRDLNPRIYLLNTVTSAPTAARALGAAAHTHAAAGQFLATVLRHHSLRGRANPLLSPASTLRETAVKVVLAADSALSTADVLERVSAVLGGRGFAGSTTGATARRDLTQREAGHNAGQPRVLTTHVAGRCLYYGAHLPRATAVARYLARQQHHQVA
jgi:hypothetical protein